ncbi:MAG TPA: hypothetical protein VM658_12720 [bacterium]|nr:hypothetical protein [bacterium]
MFDRIKKLFTDNRIRDLLSGNMVAGEDMVNEFIRTRGLPPGFTLLRLRCGDGEALIEAEGELQGMRFRASGSARLLGVRVTADEQVVKIMPAGRAELKTDNLESVVTITPGPGFINEASALLKLLAPELAAGIAVEPDCLKLSLHRYPFWSNEFAKRIKEIPLIKELQINLLDYVEIHDLRIEPGRVRILARRK